MAENDTLGSPWAVKALRTAASEVGPGEAGTGQDEGRALGRREAKPTRNCLPYPGGGVHGDTVFDEHVRHWNVAFLCYQMEGGESALERKRSSSPCVR